MEVITAQFVFQKEVLLKFDLDVPIENGLVVNDFRLKMGLPTLKLCLENASEVIIIGHVGRPEGKDPEFSVAPIYQWFLNNGFHDELRSGKLKILENLRFEEGESFDSAQDLRDENIEFAKELAELGEVYVNEAFAAYHPAASTTVLPTLLPHTAGLQFAREVAALTKVRENPKHPLIVIMGGAKVQDKLPVIEEMVKIADQVLVGGKIAQELQKHYDRSENVSVGQLTEDGFDITEETIQSWKEIIIQAKMIVWNGPMGKIENETAQKGTRKLAQLILESEAEVIVGGGDTVGFLSEAGLLEQFEQKGFVSSGGGAMLKFLSEGTLPTIQALI